jgi:hypothetical protein
MAWSRTLRKWMPDTAEKAGWCLLMGAATLAGAVLHDQKMLCLAFVLLSVRAGIFAAGRYYVRWQERKWPPWAMTEEEAKAALRAYVCKVKVESGRLQVMPVDQASRGRVH